MSPADSTTRADAAVPEQILPSRPDLRRALLTLAARGNCADSTDPEQWFRPVQGHARARAYAAALCQGCPVLDTCRAYALAAGEEYGVWGGLCELDRAQLGPTARSRELLRRCGADPVPFEEAG